MSRSLYATFADSHLAARAVGALLDHGGDAASVSLVCDQRQGHSGPHEENPLAVDGAVDEASHGVTVTTPGDAASGAVKGASIGLGVGAIAGLVSLVIPGFGIVVGGGALAMAIGAAAATTAAGALAGGVTGYLQDQGVPDLLASDYDEAVAGGQTLLAVHVPCGVIQQPEVERLLAKYGATDVGHHG